MSLDEIELRKKSFKDTIKTENWQKIMSSLIAGSLFIVLVVYVFYRFAPLSYGFEQSKAACESLKWRSRWDFNCP